ncbi:MAG: putative rane protein, partial [Gemmatimonadetes bacterium]|nr:putative rane protein [Gemmatimonadota bacterium]
PVASYASPGHDGKLFVSALLPLALWMLVRGVRDGRRWAWGALAITVGLAVLSPHPQLLQYLLLTSGAFALFLAFGADGAGAPLDRRTGVRRLVLALGAVLVGMAIGAIQYVPVREYVAWSPRAAGMDYASATSYSFPPIELVNMYLPQFTGILDRYWGPNLIHLHSEYLGASVLVLAVAALGGAKHRRFRRFWIGAAIVSLLWALGGNTPVFRVIYALVPGTKFFRAPSTIIYVFALAASVLAALGTKRLLRREWSSRYVLGWVVGGLVIAVLATAGVLPAIAAAAARAGGERYAAMRGMDPSVFTQVGDQFGERANVNATDLIIGAWRSLVFLVLLAAAVVAYLRGVLSVKLFGVAVLATIALDLWSVEREYWRFSPPARVLYAADPAIELLKKEKEPGRVLVRAQSDSGIAQSDPYFGGRGDGVGTGLMVHGVRSVTGYHGNEIGRYQQLEQSGVGANGAAPALLSPAFWRHENTRFLYTNSPVADPQLRLLVGPVKNSAGSTVYLYRLPGENPYAWVATAMTRAPDAEVERAVIDPRFDPLRIAVFDSSAPLPITPPKALPEPSALKAATESYGPGRASLALSGPAPAGSALVVSENYFPGWKASANGRPVPVFRADFNLIGIALPAGTTHVDLVFHDRGVDTGGLITVLAFMLAALAVVAGILQERKLRLD